MNATSTRVNVVCSSSGGSDVSSTPTCDGRAWPAMCPFVRAALRPSTSADVDYVVTEQGIAELAGATAHERAERLIAVAHPDDREELEAFLSST